MRIPLFQYTGGTQGNADLQMGDDVDLNVGLILVLIHDDMKRPFYRQPLVLQKDQDIGKVLVQPCCDDGLTLREIEQHTIGFNGHHGEHVGTATPCQAEGKQQNENNAHQILLSTRVWVGFHSLFHAARFLHHSDQMINMGKRNIMPNPNY